MLELALIPLLLVAGLTLTFLGVNGFPRSIALRPVIAVRYGPGARLYPLAEKSRPVVALAAPLKASDDDAQAQLKEAIYGDVLIADLMKEMIGLREQIEFLQREIENYKSKSSKSRAGSRKPKRGSEAQPA